MSATSRHSREVTLAFPTLVDRGFLVASGQKRDKSYCHAMPCHAMPGMELPSPEEVFANALSSLPNLTHRVQDLTHSEPDLLVIHPEKDEYGLFIRHLRDKPFIDDLDEISDEFRSELFKLATASRKHQRLDTEVMKGCWSGTLPV